MSASNKSQRLKQSRPAKEALLIFLWQTLPWGVVLFGLLICISLFISAAQAKKEALDTARTEAAKLRSAEAVPVIAHTIEPVSFKDCITLPGEVAAWESVEICPEVSGKIIPLNPDLLYRSEGDWVSKGEVLTRIDERDYEAALEDAEARFKLAKLTYERSEKLATQGAMTGATLDQNTASFRQAKAACDTARLQLERCTIRAPFDGVINARTFSVGSLVGPSEKVYDLMDINKVKVRVGIPQSDVGLVRHVRAADILIDAFPGKVFPAAVHFLSYNTLQMAKVYELELVLDNAEHLLRPGMMVEARIVREVKPEAIVVPLYTILTNGTEQYCYVAIGNKALRKAVRVGRISGTEAEIVEGLAIGDRLIVKGQRQCVEGTLLSVIHKNSPSATEKDNTKNGSHGDSTKAEGEALDSNEVVAPASEKEVSAKTRPSEK